MEFIVNHYDSGGLDHQVIVSPTHPEGHFLVNNDDSERLHLVRTIRLRRVGQESLREIVSGERDGVSLGLLYPIPGRTSGFAIKSPYYGVCEEYPNTKVIDVSSFQEVEPHQEPVIEKLITPVVDHHNQSRIKRVGHAIADFFYLGSYYIKTPKSEKL